MIIVIQIEQIINISGFCKNNLSSIFMLSKNPGKSMAETCQRIKSHTILQFTQVK